MIKTNDALKDALKNLPVEHECCLQTMLSIAFRLYGSLHRRDGHYYLEFRHDDAGVLRRIIDFYGRFYGQMIEREITYNESKYWVHFIAPREVLSRLMILSNDGEWLPELHVTFPCCRSHALREIVFLKGYLMAFQEGYQLEIRVKDELFRIAADLLQVAGIKCYEYDTRLIIRGACHLQELFEYLGCTTMIDILTAQAEYNENKNKTVLLTNYTMANVNRQVESFEHYKEVISRIDTHFGIENLPDTLKELVALRLDNPTLSFEELGKLFARPISKGGISSRMKKLERIYEKLGGKV